MVVYQKNHCTWTVKHFLNARILSLPFKQFKARGMLLTLQHCGLRETVGNVKFIVLGVIGGWFCGVYGVLFCFVCAFSFLFGASDRNRALQTFWRPPRKAEGSCILYFPWDLMKYTASGLLSIWTFRLLNQWKGDLSCHKRHMLGVTCCLGVLMPVVDIISTPYTLITIHSVQTMQSALRQAVLNQH